MRFDIQQYLSNEGLFFRSSGENCAKNHVVINCPFCTNDTGQHLGIDLSTGHWGCWRDSAHRGKSLVRLISKLSGCSSHEAAGILGYDKVVRAEYAKDFDSIDNIEDLFAEQVSDVTEQRKTLSFSHGIKPVATCRQAEKVYDYLINKRGFREGDEEDICTKYNLHYADTGDFKGRLVLPVFMGSELTSYTGRDIGRSSLRYRSSTAEESIVNIYDSLGGYNDLMTSRGKILFIVEGPLDFLKLDYYARDLDCRATCIFSKHVSELQISYIADVAKNFEKVVILLDPEEIYDSMVLEDKLSFLRKASVGQLPKGVEDPGDLSPRQVFRFVKDLLLK